MGTGQAARGSREGTTRPHHDPRPRRGQRLHQGPAGRGQIDPASERGRGRSRVHEAVPVRQEEEAAPGANLRAADSGSGSDFSSAPHSGFGQ